MVSARNNRLTMRAINWSWPDYSDTVIARISSLVKSGRVNQLVCETVESLEQAWARQFDADHVIAVTNGTHALELALMALGIGAGDEVIVPARTFIACATAIMRVGATPVFADVDLRTQGLSRTTVEPLINSRTRAILVVHLGGHPSPLLADVSWVRDRNLYLIEDFSQAVGAQYDGRYLGTFGDVACASLCNEKNISAGEGGIVQTPSSALAVKLRQFRNHGISEPTPGSAGNFIYARRVPGSNYRLSPLAAALALDHVERWPILSRRRAYIAAACRSALGALPYFEVPEILSHETPGWYRVYFFVRSEFRHLRSAWAYDLSNAGIPLASVSCPDVRLEPMFDGRIARSHLPNTRRLGETSLALPAYPSITDDDLATLLARIQKFKPRSQV